MMRATTCLVVAALLAGVPLRALANDTSRPSLTELVRERTGVTVGWPLNDRAEAARDDTVQALLQDSLTADRAVRVALLNSRELRAAFGEVGITQADYRQALLPKNPQLEGEIRFGGGGRRPGEIIVMQDLTSLLLTPARRRASSSALRQSTLRAADAATALVAETRSAFYGVQAGNQVQGLWERAVEAAQAGADLAQRQHAVGNITDLDLENEQAVYEQAKVELARSRTEALIARERLNRAMGVWGERTAWVVASELPGLPAKEAPLDSVESAAVLQRLDLAAAEAEIQALARSVPLARFSQFPELRAGAHFEREPEGTRTTGPAVELAFPLFDRGQAAVARAKAQIQQAEDRRDALAISIRSQVRAARDRFSAARQVVEYYHDVILPRRTRIVEQTQLQFNGMLVGVNQLIQAKQREISAQREYIEAQREYWLARTELDRALGASIPGADGK